MAIVVGGEWRVVHARGAGCSQAELGVVYAMEIDWTMGGIGESLAILG